MTYNLGQVANISASFNDNTGTPIDPTTVSLDITTPDGVTTTYAYPANIGKVSTGLYQLLYPTTQYGNYGIRWYSTGVGQTAFTDSFYVDPVAPPGLVTLSVAKEWLNVTDTSQDTLITRLIQAASKAVGNFLNRPNLLSQTYTETYDGTDSKMLCPLNFPITSVASLSIDGNPVSQVTDFTTPGFRVTPTSLLLNGYQRFCRGKDNVAITYTAGYTAIPDDMQQACLMTLQSMVQVQNNDLTIGSESTGGYSVTYRPTGVGRVPEDAKDLLKTYKRVIW